MSIRLWRSIAAVTSVLALATVVLAIKAKYARLDSPVVTQSRPFRSGSETQLILIGANGCAGSRAPQLQSALRVIHRVSRRAALSAGRRFSYVGVAIDPTVKEGQDFLDHFGPFDEIVAGGNWANIGAARFIWRDFPGRSTVPQLVVLERTIHVDTTGVKIGAEKILFRKISVDSIVAYANALKGIGDTE